jgi:hypothetical protein
VPFTIAWISAIFGAHVRARCVDEVEHDDLAAEVGQPHDAAVGGAQREIGCRFVNRLEILFVPLEHSVDFIQRVRLRAVDKAGNQRRQHDQAAQQARA